MTIDISTPDGSSFQFPDGTPYDTIKGALDKHYGVNKPAPITADNLVRAAGRGVPIIGGLLDKANAATYAALQPAYATIAPDTEKADTTISHAPSFGERYTENLAKENVKDLSFAKEHPVANTAAELAGGIASTGGAATTATGARLLGLTGKTLPQAITRGAISGTAVNAADAITRGEDPIASGTLGGAIGAAAPVAGRIASTALAPVTNAIRGIANPGEEALRRWSASLERDVRSGTAGMTEPELRQALSSGQPVNLMDMGGETTRALARSAANTSPEGFAVLNKAINDRFTGQGGRIGDWFQSGMNYPTDAARNAAIAHVSQNEIGPAYMKALGDAANVKLWSQDRIPGGKKAWEGIAPQDPQHKALLNQLAELVQMPDVQKAITQANFKMRNWAVLEGRKPPEAAFKVVKGADGPQTILTENANSTNLPSLRYWDYIKRALDEMGGSSPEARMASRAIRENIDQIVPAYGQARAAAQPQKFFAGASDAFEAGQNFFRSAGKFDAADTQKALGSMSPTQAKLFQDGYSQAYMDFIEKHPNRRNLLNEINKSPAATKELETALGLQRARELEMRLRTEQIMDQSRGAVQGNSTTARQLMQLGLAGGVYGIEGGGLNLDPNAMMHAALIYGAARGKNAIDTRVAKQVADLLVSQDPSKINMGMKLLGQKPAMMNGIRQFDTAIASILGRGSLPALTGP